MDSTGGQGQEEWVDDAALAQPAAAAALALAAAAQPAALTDALPDTRTDA